MSIKKLITESTKITLSLIGVFASLMIVWIVQTLFKNGNRSEAHLLVIAVITFSVAVWFIRMWLMAKKEKGNHNHEKNRHLLFPKQKMSYLVFAALVFLISGSFYWFEVRQVRIKHDCSWVKRHSNAVPSRPVMTAEELKSKGIIDSCEDGFKFYGQFADYNEAVIEQCEAKNKRLVEEYKQPKRAEPEKDWQVKATKEEYEFCLHDRGL